MGKEVKQLYHQNGQTIEHSMYTVNGNQHDSITTDFCKDWVAEAQDGTNFLEKGGMDAIDKALQAGVVLVMSLWDDHEANMLWLASTYPVDSTTPGGPSPSPSPSPAPTPSSECCTWDGKYCGATSDYCKATASQCADCGGTWCTDCLPPYTTAAPMTV